MNWPVVSFRHREAATRVLNSNALTEGPEVERLEEEFAAWAHRRYAVATASGTAAIELALAAAGVRKKSKVSIPAYAFSGSALGALRLGAKIDWVDVDPRTFLAEQHHWATPEVAIVVHLFGQRAVIPSAPVVIEDCSHAFGGPVGRLGVVSCWSLNQSKTVWAGEGGILATDDEGLADTARELRCYGGAFTVSDDRAYNFKLAELPAAFARASLKDVGTWTRGGVDMARAMNEALRSHPQIRPPYVPEGRSHVFHKYRVTFPGGSPPKGIGVPWERWQQLPLPALPAFGAVKDYEKQWPGATEGARDSFSIGNEQRPPCTWTEDEINRWVELL